MIYHVVLIRMREGTTEAQQASLVSAMRALKDRVPGVLRASAGIDFGGRSGEYPVAAVVELADRAALAAYASDPAHQEVVQLLDEISDGRIVADYEE